MSRLLALGLVAAVAAVAYVGWLRDSSLVAVERVTVTGLGTRDAADMRSAVVAAARRMTTLHVREQELEAALGRYPVVRAVKATPDFPDRLLVRVLERRPVATVSGPSGEGVPVAADGTLLRRVRPRSAPARVRAEGSLAGERLEDRATRTLVGVLGVAPVPLLERAVQARRDGARGVVVSLRRGPEIVFGKPVELRAKWAAAARVLATPAARGATYIDVRLPDRPAAGGVGPMPEPAEPEGPETGDAETPVTPQVPLEPLAVANP